MTRTKDQAQAAAMKYSHVPVGALLQVMRPNSPSTDRNAAGRGVEGTRRPRPRRMEIADA